MARRRSQADQSRPAGHTAIRAAIPDQTGGLTGAISARQPAAGALLTQAAGPERHP
jgi:hypothetical protein